MEINRVPLVCFGTANFEPLYIRFAASVDERFDIQYSGIDAVISKNPGGGKGIWVHKLDLLLAALDKYASSPLVAMADIDIQFFAGHFEAFVEQAMTNDLTFQQENDNCEVNIGIIAMKPTEGVREFWRMVRRRVISSGHWDQKVVNDFIFAMALGRDFAPKDVKIGVFSREFWNWSSGRVPNKPYCHHSNFTSDLHEKWRQLDVVDDILGNDHSFTEAKRETFLGEWNTITLGAAKPEKMVFLPDGNLQWDSNSFDLKWDVQPNRVVLFDERDRRTSVLSKRYKSRHDERTLYVGIHAHFINPEFWKNPKIIAIYR